MNVLELFKNITTFVFDMDGVLTDGTLLLMPGGIMARKMNIKDGYALQLAIKKGYNVIVISGGALPEAEERLRKLGVRHVFMSCQDKKATLQDFLSANSLRWEEVLFMGDDMPDYEAMKLTGLPCCPLDAVMEIRQVSQYISPLKGGEGCVRDVIEKLLKLRGDWAVDPLIKAQ